MNQVKEKPIRLILNTRFFDALIAYFGDKAWG